MSIETWDPFEYRNKGNEYKDTRKEKIKERVVEIVRKNDFSGGISEKQLAKEIDKYPKNLRKYLTELVREGLIFKKNKLAPYFSTDKSYQDPLLKANIVGKKFSERIKKYAQKEFIILADKKGDNYSSNRICTLPDSSNYNSSHSIYHDFCILFERYKFFYQPKFTADYKFETFLFEFSNMVGGFISYFLIKTLVSDNNKNTSNKGKFETRDYNIILEYFSNVIPILYQTFREDIDKIEGKYPTFSEYKEMNKEKVSTLKNLSLKTSNKTDEDKKIIEEITNDYYQYRKDYFQNRSRRMNTNNKEMIDKLEKSFFNIYPLLYHELKKIDIKLDNELSKYTEFINNIQIKSELQKKCNHVYGFPTLDIFGNYVRACKNKITDRKGGYEICGYRLKIDKSLGKSFIQMDDLLNSNEDNFVITNFSINKKGKKSVQVRIENDKGIVENIIFVREGIEICNEYIEQLPVNKKEI